MVEGVYRKNYALCKQLEGLGEKRLKRDAGENSRSMFKVNQYHLMTSTSQASLLSHSATECTHP